MNKYAILHMQMLCNGMGQSMHSIFANSYYLSACNCTPAGILHAVIRVSPSSFNQSLHASIHRPVDFHRILHRILLTFLLLFCSYIPLRSICLSHASQASILFFFLVISHQHICVQLLDRSRVAIYISL